MVSSLFVFKILMMWAVISISIEASQLSSTELETKALINTEWFNYSFVNISNHCHWAGIVCNAAGSATAIQLDILVYDFNSQPAEIELGQLNFSCFPNLEVLSGPFSYVLTGSIPSQIGVLSKLKQLDLHSNNLTGTIPREIGNLKNLRLLDFSNNKHLSGNIPSQISALSKLNHLALSSTNLTGDIPQEIGNLKNLVILNLKSNILTGLPSNLGHLTSLTTLYLSGNKLNDSIPITIGELRYLENLDLSDNKITGTIPLKVRNCLNLQYLNLSGNHLSGNIPQLPSLYCLDLSHNNLSGTIPNSLTSLEYLDLSYNNLSGTIPNSLYASYHIDLSYNNLEGLIPDSLHLHCLDSQILHNKGLCLQNQGLNPSVLDKPKPSSIILFTIIFLSITISSSITICGLLFLLKRSNKKGTKLHVRAIKSGDMFSIWNYDGRIAFEDIIEATNNFDIEYCIGTGGYGSVYKAQLPNGKIVALKKLHSVESEEPTFIKSFENEVEILSRIRHRNIVKLYGFCLHKKCMFLAYEYLERGSLFCILNNDDEALELN